MRTLIIAEIGLNHQGDINIAKKLIDAAVVAGADVVKFQKRTPEVCLPEKLWGVERDTPWGRMSYLEYRQKIELSKQDYSNINNYCWRKIQWTASPWDVKSVAFLEKFHVPFYKVASASVTDLKLLEVIRKTGRPVIMSTGMSTLEQIRMAVSQLGGKKADITLMVCTSAYPCPINKLNLNRIRTLKKYFPMYRIGYSGHEVGLWTTLCAAAMGAEVVERHFTLDRAMKGSDHAASIEPAGLALLVREIRALEAAWGIGNINPVDIEKFSMESLRRYK